MEVDEVMNIIHVSDPTARKAMAELKALGLVDVIELGVNGKPLVQMYLKNNFEWFTESLFKDKLKGDYMPGDFKEFLISKGKETARETK